MARRYSFMGFDSDEWKLRAAAVLYVGLTGFAPEHRKKL
jgi:hypothetical protein